MLMKTWRWKGYVWCWLNGSGGGFGIRRSWVQIPLYCWINTRWGWLCLSSFRGRQNEIQLAGILCPSGDPSRIVPNSQGDRLGSTNALHRVWSQWMDRCLGPVDFTGINHALLCIMNCVLCVVNCEAWEWANNKHRKWRYGLVVTVHCEDAEKGEMHRRLQRKYSLVRFLTLRCSLGV